MFFAVLGMLIAAIAVYHYSQKDVQRDKNIACCFFRDPLQLNTAGTAVENTHLANPSIRGAEDPYAF